MMKVSNLKITGYFLEERASYSELMGYNKQKWIVFCETLLSEGFQLFLYEARETCSKYITVKRSKRVFKVRFSNHKPIKQKELNQDCDFFVGVTHTGVRTTEDALFAVRQFFGEKNHGSFSSQL